MLTTYTYLGCASVEFMYKYIMRMYLWWNLCSLSLHVCQVGVTVGDLVFVVVVVVVVVVVELVFRISSAD